MTKLTVNVTEQHIADGCRSDPYLCPIALAIGEHDLGHVSVGYFSVSVYDDYAELTRTSVGILPDQIRTWIGAFDRKEKVSPITFELELN